MYAELYGQAITGDLFGRAAVLASRLKTARPDADMGECAALAVSELFCSCVSLRETCTCHTPAYVRDALIDEVCAMAETTPSAPLGASGPRC